MTTTTAEDYQAEVERLRKEAGEVFLLDFSLEQADLDLVEPRVFEAPHCWTWADMFPLLLRTAELVPLEHGGRRELLYSNPSLFPKPYMTNTLCGGCSIYNPRDTAPVHLHASSAVRVMLHGDGAFTTVDGEKCEMRRGDLVLTPNGAWHDHGNDGREPIIWLDILDIPMVDALNSTFYEFDYQEEDANSVSKRLVSKKVQTVRLPADYSHDLYATGGLKPKFVSHRRDRGGYSSPMFIYRYEQARATLEKLSAYDGSPYDGILMEYVDPVTGNSAMPTMAMQAQLLRPGEHTSAHRHTASTVYCVLEGRGATVVNEARLEWTVNDVFAVPSWMWHEHINLDDGVDAVLTSISDAAALQKLGLYREQGRRPSGEIIEL